MTSKILRIVIVRLIKLSRTAQDTADSSGVAGIVRLTADLSCATPEQIL